MSVRWVRGGPEPLEHLVDRALPAVGEDALGLLDDVPAGQRGLQLLALHHDLLDRPLLQDRDGGDVRRRLAEGRVFGAEGCPGF